MNQKKDAKTIVFAVKMFSYWARNIFWFKEFPKEIMIPIDSRLEKLFYEFWPHPNPTPGHPSLEQSSIHLDLLWGERGHKEIKNFYKELSEKLNISLLHLDAILWVNYEELVREKNLKF
jgi:DNA-(apurinic or apyrimidinic site) lyase